MPGTNIDNSVIEQFFTTTDSSVKILMEEVKPVVSEKKKCISRKNTFRRSSWKNCTITILIEWRKSTKFYFNTSLQVFLFRFRSWRRNRSCSNWMKKENKFQFRSNFFHKTLFGIFGLSRFWFMGRNKRFLKQILSNENKIFHRDLGWKYQICTNWDKWVWKSRKIKFNNFFWCFWVSWLWCKNQI